MNATELFPKLLCRGCGHHGLSEANARIHRGTKSKGSDRAPACRGGKARTRDAKCLLCGEDFHDLRETSGPGRLKKKRWCGGRIYAHKLAHIINGDKSEDFA